MAERLNIPDLAGIYKIQFNDKIYIGSAINFRKRKNVHIHRLRKNNHDNAHLQSAYNKYGEEEFIFTPILICESFELIRYEQSFIDILCPEYNICKVANSMLGYRHTKKTRKKLSKSKMGLLVGYKHTKEAKKNMSEAQSLRGRTVKVSDETIERLKKSHSKINWGSFISPEGIIYRDVFNLSEFSRVHSITSRPQMCRLSREECAGYLGWRKYYGN